MQEKRKKKGKVRQASTNEHKLMSKKGAVYIYQKMEYNNGTQVCQEKRKGTKKSRG